MSSSALKLLAASGAKGGATYVDDVFSTFLYEGTGVAQGIQNGINLGDFGVGTSTKFAHNTDFLSRSSDLTGNADGKTFTFSCWVFLTPKIDDNPRTLYATDSSDNGILIAIQANNTLSMEAWNGGVRTLQLATSTVIGTNVWTNILVSLDFANSSNRYIYFNDAAATVSYYTYNNANVEFTRPTHYIGIWGNGTTKGLHDDSLAHMYLDYTYRDLSTESNRRIFIDANGGSTSASSLTALNPIMYIPMTTAYAVGKNAGTGGDFTSNGSPTIVENGTEYVADSGKGGLLWIKDRDTESHHILVDTVRGPTKTLWSGGDGQYPERTETTYVTGFTSSGFTVGSGGEVNGDGKDNVSWTFRKQPGFFDVVTYTGTGSAQNISHNLGSVPGCIIIKNLSNTADWTVYHRGVDATAPEDYNLALNKTDARDDNVAYFNDTAPTSTVFTVNSDSTTNTNGDTYVAYLFAHDAQEFGTNEDESIIKCGSYTGNSGSQTIDVGFEAQWVLIKNTSSSSTDWFVVDVMRGLADTSAVDAALIRANESDAEQTSGAGGARITTRNTGFGFISESNLSCNRSGETYIYMAIRRPNKPASEFAATDLFALAGNTYTTSDPAFVSGFPVDMGLSDGPDMGWDKDIATRLTGTKRQETNKDSAEGNQPAYKWDYMNGYMSGTNGSTYGWQWRRAPGFFDVVTYEGNTSNPRTIAHNLGAVPEMIWVKSRGPNTASWRVYDSINGPTKGLWLNQTYGSGTEANWWSNTAPTNALFTVGGESGVNATNQSFIAYLFASVAGISKLGSYTGTGNDLNVDCGFSAGARFILIKRTDELYGDNGWYVWDSARGIVSGNDPYILLNSSAAQVTNTDYIDPLASGFTVTSSAPAALNNNGGTYLFYAIA